jgi:hypothetical protein
MSETRRCAEVRGLIPELAMGVAPGDERAAALAHIATCADCRQLLEETAEAVDELLLLAPEREPPTGFDAKVMEAIGLERRDRSRRWNASKLVLAAAVVLLAAASAAGLTRWAGADDRELAQQYRETLSVAKGSYFDAAPLVGNQQSPAGHVFAYQGNPSWVFVTVEDAPSGVHRVRYVTDDGRTHWLGVCKVRDGRGSWGTAIDVPAYAVDRVELVRNGSTLSADFE